VHAVDSECMQCVASALVGIHLVNGIQRIYHGGWDPRAESVNSKSEQVKQGVDLDHCLHWLHLEPTYLLYYCCMHWLHLEPLTHLLCEGQ
jgi:hypothetical protein